MGLRDIPLRVKRERESLEMFYLITNEVKEKRKRIKRIIIFVF